MWFRSKHRHPTIRTIVGDGSTITGDLRFTDGLRIDGEVHGDVIGDGPAPTLVVVAEKARIVGKLAAGHIIISGEVSGAVESSELLELLPRARIDGDVRYEALEMHKGASISGELRPLDATERASRTPAPAPDRSESAAASAPAASPADNMPHHLHRPSGAPTEPSS
jgi:cytoskeletal protein CcmA (bactofilin family)